MKNENTSDRKVNWNLRSENRKLGKNHSLCEEMKQTCANVSRRKDMIRPVRRSSEKYIRNDHSDIGDDAKPNKN